MELPSSTPSPTKGWRRFWRGTVWPSSSSAGFPGSAFTTTSSRRSPRCSRDPTGRRTGSSRPFAATTSSRAPSAILEAATRRGRWSTWWGDEKLPFYFVQLASFRAREAQPSEGGWPRLRESQLKTLALHDTGMAVAIDIGAAMEIHPRNKQDVGRRLARWAMRDCYGDTDIEVSGPLYASNAVEGDKIRISFTHVGGGLKAKGDALKGFAIAAVDKKFVWAQASIEGESVVVWNANIASPRYVRYAWADNPECTLYNGAGLPASPFRTDQ